MFTQAPPSVPAPVPVSVSVPVSMPVPVSVLMSVPSSFVPVMSNVSRAVPNMSVLPPNLVPNVTTAHAQSAYIPGNAPQYTTAAQSTVPGPSFNFGTQPTPQVGSTQFYAAPSQPSQPIQPIVGDADYYLSLTPPWNKLPIPGSAGMFKDSRKNPGFIVKFDGSTNYTAWRRMFISRVHRMEIPVYAKVQMMISSMDGSNMHLSNIVDNLSEEDAFQGYRKGIRVLENLYGVQTQEFEEAVAAVKALPVANDALKWKDLLCAVQMILNAAAREGVTDLKKNTHALLFESIESKLPATHQGVYRNFVGEVIANEVLTLAHVEQFIKRQTNASSHTAAPASSQSRPQTQTQT